MTLPTFLETLRTAGVLEPGQWNQLDRRLQSESPSAAELARDLVRQGWLTPYQANQLNRGHATDLVIGPYVVLDRLGGGGMGDVYKARHRLIRTRTVALKVIRSDCLGDGRLSSQAIGRFEREPEALARLSHPNIATLHDAGKDGGRLYLVMEHLEGRDLARVVTEDGPLPTDVACDCVWQAAQGLQHLHECGMVHRDIKPGNLLRTTDGVVKILDLGLVLWPHDAVGDVTTQELTKQVAALGTPAYWAPEQAADPHNVDIRADLYSLGRTLHFLLTGRVPGLAGSLPSNLPDGLLAVLGRLMARRPDERFDTPADAANALAPYCNRPLRVREPDTVRPVMPSRNQQSQRWILAAVLLMGLVAAMPIMLLAGGLLFWRLWPSLTQARATQNGSTSGEFIRPKEGMPPPPPPDGPLSTRSLVGHPQEVMSVCFVPLKDQALSCSFQEMILWDLKTGQSLQTRSLHDRGGVEFPAGPGKPEMAFPDIFMPGGVAAFPDGKRALVGGNSVRFWDLKEWKPNTTHSVPHTGIVGASVAVSGNGRVAAFANHDNIVRLFDAATEKELPPRLQGYLVSLSADGSLALTGEFNQGGAGTGAVRLFDTRDGTKLASFSQHRRDVSAVAISPYGMRGVSAGSSEKEFILWDLSDPKVMREVRRFTGHQTATGPFSPVIQALAFSPDGRRILSGGDDATVRLWETDTGREVVKFEQHDKAVTAVAFSPAGAYALSGSRDKTVKLWKLPE